MEVTNLWAILELGVFLTLLLVMVVAYYAGRFPFRVTRGVRSWLRRRGDRDDRIYREHRRRFVEEGKRAMKGESWPL